MSVLRNIESWIERTLTSVIDFFYPPFGRFMSLELFRYAACGGLNLALDWVLYYVFYHFVLRGQVLDLGIIAFKPHIAAFLLRFPFTFLTGFWMARHISFSGSTLRGRTQIVRYLLVAIGNILLNYFGLKLFVEVFHWWPTIAYILVSVICVTFSFLSNKFYSFSKSSKHSKP